MNARKLRWYDYAVALAPLLLVLTFGAIGVAVGAAGSAVNLAIVQSSLSQPMRFTLAFAVTGLALFVWIGLGIFMH